MRRRRGTGCAGSRARSSRSWSTRSPPKRYIITEAPVRLQTPEGVRRYPAGTMFQVLSFIPVNKERKVPPGKKLGELVSTEEKPLSSTVLVAWARR